VASSYKGITRTFLRKELSMKTSLSINHEGHVRQLVKLAALTLLATPVFAQTYTITDLGTLGRNSNGSYSIAYCINGSGQVAGESSAPSHQMSDPAFLYSNGQLINIGTLGGEYGQARGINTSGQIAGYSTLATGSYRAFLYTDGQMMDIGTLGADYSVAYALNDSGQVVGNSAFLSGQDHAFLYNNGQMTDLGTLGGDTSNAYGINNLGVIVGYSYNSSVCDQRPEPDRRPGLHQGQPCGARVPPQQRANGRPGHTRWIDFLGPGDQQQRYSRGICDYPPQ
jgi:probable HAF family extracellular repeat protein